jgi:hypothetical protein
MVLLITGLVVVEGELKVDLFLVTVVKVAVAVAHPIVEAMALLVLEA